MSKPRTPFPSPMPRGYQPGSCAPLLRTLCVPVSCAHCGAVSPRAHGSILVDIKDLPRKGAPFAFVVDRRRYRCGVCRKTFCETLPGVSAGRGMTVRLLLWIVRRAARRPFVEVACGAGTSEANVRAIFSQYLNGLALADKELVLRTRNSNTKAIGVRGMARAVQSVAAPVGAEQN